MTKTLRRIGILAAAALLTTTLGLTPVYAVGSDDNPSPPSDSSKGKGDKKKSGQKSKSKKKSDAEFLNQYRVARALILAKKYKEGIAAMHAIGHDDHPDVANYVGYAHRKMGDFGDAKIWYERALAADPRHVRTWSYYGMLQMAQARPDLALAYLDKVEAICGNKACREYRELYAVIEGTATY
jgi:tetratricopeptide (TPR) repeat protein